MSQEFRVYEVMRGDAATGCGFWLYLEGMKTRRFATSCSVLILGLLQNRFRVKGLGFRGSPFTSQDQLGDVGLQVVV